ncbi:zinc finger domain-containing protein, partial [Pyxidicoccus sp. 3LFB2]
DGARDGLVVTPGAPPVEGEDPGKKRAERFCVYGRTGLPCPRCGAKVRRVELAARGLYFCAGCQGVDALPRVPGRRKRAAGVGQ